MASTTVAPAAQSATTRFLSRVVGSVRISSSCEKPVRYQRQYFASASAVEMGKEDRSKALTTATKMPYNFMSDTLLPHLEYQVTYVSPKMLPYDLSKLTVAYSLMPVRQRVLEKQLADATIEEIKYFRPEELISIMQPHLIMNPNNRKVFTVMAARLIQMLHELSGLNLIGVMRIFLNRAMAFQMEKQGVPPEISELIKVAGPRLSTELATFEPDELSDVLVSIGDNAATGTTKQDMILVGIVLPEVEKRYYETSIYHTTLNLWSCARLKVYPEALIEAFEQELISRPKRLANIPPKFAAKLAWTFACFNKLDNIMPVLGPVIEGLADSFQPGEFARLSQALPVTYYPLLVRIMANLLPKVPEMGRNQFMLFLNGAVRQGFLPLETSMLGGPAGETKTTGEGVDVTKADARKADDDKQVELTVDRENVLEACFAYIEAEQDRFSNEEVKRIGHLLLTSRQYKYLVHRLPEDWKQIL